MQNRKKRYKLGENIEKIVNASYNLDEGYNSYFQNDMKFVDLLVLVNSKSL